MSMLGLRKISGWVIAVLVLSGCGGGGGGGAPATIDGSWGGAKKDNFFEICQRSCPAGSSFTTFRMMISGDSISSVIIGGQATAVTGQISLSEGDLFVGSLAGGSLDGVAFGFFTDPARNHAVFISSDGKFGVLQKGADAPSSTTTYSLADIDGSYAGTAAVTNNAVNYTLAPASGSCSNSQNCTVTIQGNTANVTLIGANGFGGLFGDWLGSDDEDGDGVGVMMSVDKSFVGSWTCPTGATIATIADCTFIAANRN